MFANAIDEQYEGIAVTPITDYIVKRTMLEGTSQYPIEDVLLKGETAKPARFLGMLSRTSWQSHRLVHCSLIL